MHVNRILVFPNLFPLITGAEKEMVQRGTQTKIFFFNTDDEHDQRVYASLSSIAGLGGEDVEQVEGDTSPKSALFPPPSSSDTPPPPPPPPPSPLRENGVVSGVLAHDRVWHHLVLLFLHMSGSLSKIWSRMAVKVDNRQ